MCPIDPSAYFWKVAASSQRIGSPSQRRRSTNPPSTMSPRTMRCRRVRGARSARVVGRTPTRLSARAAVAEVDTALDASALPTGSRRTMASMDEDAPQSDAEAIREAEENRAIRARRDAELSPEERLERVHELCRQLAAIRPAQSQER